MARGKMRRDVTGGTYVRSIEGPAVGRTRAGAADALRIARTAAQRRAGRLKPR